jgi:hypothetical protein
MPLGLLDFCEEQGLETDGHLIYNPSALTLAEARFLSPVWVLRWKYRRCRACNTDFDIEQQGIYYCCHDCLQEVRA